MKERSSGSETVNNNPCTAMGLGNIEPLTSTKIIRSKKHSFIFVPSVI